MTAWWPWRTSAGLSIGLLLGACATPEVRNAAALEGTTWKLVRIGGEPVAVGERQREPNLILDPGERRVSGSSGCNRFAGTYSVDGDRLSFSPLAATRMACADGMEQEQALFDALGRVARWRISGERLELLDGDGKSVAEFESSAASPRSQRTPTSGAPSSRPTY